MGILWPTEHSFPKPELGNFDLGIGERKLLAFVDSFKPQITLIKHCFNFSISFPCVFYGSMFNDPLLDYSISLKPDMMN